MCEHCNLKNCPILNKDQCPINQLWAQADKANEAKKELTKVNS